MLKYVIRRILLFIPTLIIISLLAFIISINAPGDPVDRLLNVAESGSMSGGVAYTEKIKQEKRHELGLDLPVFYFGLGTLSDIDTLYKIPHEQHQIMLQRLVRYYGNKDAVIDYYNVLKKTEAAQASVLPDSTIYEQVPEEAQTAAIAQSRHYVTTLLETTDPEIIAPDIDSLQILSSGNKFLAGLDKDVISLREAYENMDVHAQPWKTFIPAFHFHGLNNQYHRWIKGVLKGDFGVSYRDQLPVFDRILEKLPWSFVLTLFSVILAYLISIPVGVYSAWHRNSFFDRASAVVLFALYSLPSFFVGTLLLVLFANPDFLNIFPDSGVQDPVLFDPEWSFGKKLVHWAPYLVLPLIAYTYSSFAFLSRQMRAGISDVMHQDYIRTAFAKGLPENRVLWKHAFRNALLPIITVFAAVFPAAISGSIIIETIFGIPGMGREIYESILNYDYPMIVAIFTFFGVLTLAGYLLADILYAWADPRISYSNK